MAILGLRLTPWVKGAKRMTTAIGYVRVSTAEQGRSGLGLEAQRAAIEQFAAQEQLTVTQVFEEVETGKGSDALTRRPQLAAALRAARKAKAPLLIAKLDRLARNVNFISGLMEEKVEFIVTSLGRQRDRFMLHIHASVAEKEREMISERTKAGLQAAKRRGTKLGMDAKPKDAAHRIQQAGADASAAAAMVQLEALRPHLEYALKGGASLRAAADLLNARGVESPRGGRWHAPSLLKAAVRLGLRKKAA